MIEKQIKEIDILMRARYPLLYIVSPEEGRVMQALSEVAERQEKHFFYWTETMGIQPGRANLPKEPNDKTADPLNALEKIRTTMNAGYSVVLDADIKGFFDNIDHEKLLDFVSYRISDRRVLKLIRKWLECGVLESGIPLETDKGTPQGGVISPLLANIYLHRLDEYWTMKNAFNGKLVRYADDFVILFKTKKDAETGLRIVNTILSELNLELNEEKTKIVDTTKGNNGFEFLGFHI